MNSQSLIERIRFLEELHRSKCPQYRSYSLSEFPDFNSGTDFEGLPFLPARAFKLHDLRSVESEEIYRTLVSSGTTGRPSRIFLDKATASEQGKSLIRTFTPVLGAARRPFIFVREAKNDIENTVTASRAAMIGFSMFARGVLEISTTPDEHELSELRLFLSKSVSSEGPVIFGFTAELWIFATHLLEFSNRLALSKATVLHGGGWKKLQAHAVSKSEFRAVVSESTGAQSVINYYGMVEQTGSIYVECSSGYLHEPEKGSFLVRDIVTLRPKEEGESGYVQVISPLQESYPGHSILTEDIGIKLPGRCDCGNSLSRLEILGRAPKAEIRGCSDAT
jgi:hypothetical protein